MSRKLLFLRRRYQIAAIFWLLQKNITPDKVTDTKAKKEEDTHFSRIRCPLCQWKPNASTRWCCSDCNYPEYFFNGCGTVWNTFLTGGRCPGCNHQWRWTACLSCSGWSLHEDWYENLSK